MSAKGQHSRPWLPDQKALLQQLRAEGKDWPEIGQRCGHSAQSCHAAHNKYFGTGRLSDELLAQRKRVMRPWTKADAEELVHDVEVLKLPFDKCDAKFGRSIGGCRCKYQSIKKKPVRTPSRGHSEPGEHIGITLAMIADRDARDRLRWQQPATALLMGDPLPGRSALDLRDQKRGEA